MANLSTELRRVSKTLKAGIERARYALAAGAELSRSHCEELRDLTGQFDQLVTLNGGAPGAPKLMIEAVTLLERCEPLAMLRAIKLDYIDRLVSTCDSLMTAGQMPETAYITALGSAVCDFECAHPCGDDADFLAFAWDVLAQAEAGLGEATYDAHYTQAEQRHRRVRRSSAPVLSLVSAI
jgi:hypothetical protein